MRRGMWLGLDLVIVLLSFGAGAIFLSGGWTFEWQGELIRAERARNALWALAGATLIRFGLGEHEAFLGRWPQADGVARASRRLSATLGSISSERARRFLLALLTLSASMKFWNAYHYFGFTYGDDVEIHLMNFSTLQGRDLGVWNLRSPVYPLAFIYPFQWALTAIGIQDPAWLILGGRLVVVVFSLLNVWLCYRLGVSVFGSRGVGLLAAYLLAISRLHVRLGSTELPRTVSTTFLLLAFQWLLNRGPGRAALAGIAVGVAATLRFSEAVFVIPFAVHLSLERRYRDLAITGAAALVTLLVLLGPGDRLYWPEMFFSLRNIVEFTLVRGESSRGFEPPLALPGHRAVVDRPLHAVPRRVGMAGCSKSRALLGSLADRCAEPIST